MFNPLKLIVESEQTEVHFQRVTTVGAVLDLRTLTPVELLRVGDTSPADSSIITSEQDLV